MSSTRSEPLALVDCNNFYVACERLFQPRLHGRAVAVLSNNDGCVVARSPELKALGVPMGAPAHQYRALFAREGVVVLSSNYALYGDMSARVMTVLRQRAPAIEVYSIDEAFLDLSGIAEPTAYARELAATLYRWTGIPVSIGLGPSKVLAKVANRIAKHRATPERTWTLLERSAQTAALRELPLTALWGIARRWAARLEAFGIRTALDLREADPAPLRRHFGSVLEKLHHELNGVSCLALDQVPVPRKQIIASRSFGQPLVTLDAILPMVAEHVSRAAVRLRAQGSVAGALGVCLHTNRFAERAQYHARRFLALDPPTADTARLVAAAVALVRDLYRPGYAYAKAGVELIDLRAGERAQQALFGAGDPPRRRRLMTALDTINTRFGRGTLRTAREGYDKPGRMRRERLSPAWTTCWEELPVVRAR
ncbi:MAG: Y-family DNA polymerase [Candidatus Competibacterales bacterium]|nr:Y-family DNA polymerase [Candidatus Competibacterales bacterium]